VGVLVRPGELVETSSRRSTWGWDDRRVSRGTNGLRALGERHGEQLSRGVGEADGWERIADRGRQRIVGLPLHHHETHWSTATGLGRDLNIEHAQVELHGWFVETELGP
jgi:hypothetical protein